ncbi:MAG TPA: hypothetical protein VEU96_25830 [Bryobacteraceae bacterium]|nr:hypothetical protein [Bryobacteraceae bacterium]
MEANSLNMRCVVAFLTVVAILHAAPRGRKWHDAEVVSVKSGKIFHVFEIIDSYDPSCRLTYREFRNPFRPLDISEGQKVRIAEGEGDTVYLIDKGMRTHKGRLIMQALLPPPPPPPRSNTP